MSIIKNLDTHTGMAETTLNGVVESECTYEIKDGMLILRTTTHDTIHISREMGKKLVNIIVDELL